LIGEIVRRVTGKSMGTFFKENVADKVGADFHIGLDPSNFNRVANLIPDPASASPLGLDMESITGRVFGSTNLPVGSVNSTGWRQAEIPAANGHGNAHSVVKAQTAMANHGSAFGVELLSLPGGERARKVQIESTDLVGRHRWLDILFSCPLRTGEKQLSRFFARSLGRFSGSTMVLLRAATNQQAY
jgi:CubicO group peptidase (beta-lactamase class C family)